MIRNVTRRKFFALLSPAAALAYGACSKPQSPTAPSAPAAPTQPALPIYGGTVPRSMTIDELLREANLTPVSCGNKDYGRGYVELAHSRTGWVIRVDGQLIDARLPDGRFDLPSKRVTQGQTWKVERATSAPIGTVC